jgi:hypothetical protein
MLVLRLAGAVNDAVAQVRPVVPGRVGALLAPAPGETAGVRHFSYLWYVPQPLIMHGPCFECGSLAARPHTWSVSRPPWLGAARLSHQVARQGSAVTFAMFFLGESRGRSVLKQEGPS